MSGRIVKFCAFKGCRELVGSAYVCKAHWRDLPMLLQRALTGSREPERHAAERQVDEWIKTRTLPPSRAPTRPFTDTKADHE